MHLLLRLTIELAGKDSLSSANHNDVTEIISGCHVSLSLITHDGLIKPTAGASEQI